MRTFYEELKLKEGVSVETKLVRSTSNPPASASATGTAGQIEWDSDYVYVCVATDTWKRAPLSTWP